MKSLLEFLSITVVVFLSTTTSSHAQTMYAYNLTTSEVESSSVVLSWLVPDDASSADSYLLTVMDEAAATVFNVAITDVTVTTYTVTGLTYSTFHNATLETLDSSGTTIGQGSTHYFLTAYNPVNLRALAAIGVVLGLILVLILIRVAAIIWDPDKANEMWKQELLAEQLRERDERKKKMSSPNLGIKHPDETELDLV